MNILPQDQRDLSQQFGVQSNGQIRRSRLVEGGARVAYPRWRPCLVGALPSVAGSLPVISVVLIGKVVNLGVNPGDPWPIL